MTFQVALSNPRSPLNFVFLMKAQVTRKCVNLHKSFFANCARESVGNSLQYLICLKSERVYTDRKF